MLYTNGAVLYVGHSDFFEMTCDGTASKDTVDLGLEGNGRDGICECG